ncbi:MAG: ankyrin repeat protein [Gammaproteobacteria bacterium]|jgi:ankyrin repeat protein
MISIPYKDDGTTALIIASYEGHSATVESLLKSSANINAMNKDGVTPLSIAKLRKHDNIVGMLKANGAQE